MEPIQDVIEDFIERYLTGKASFCSAQMGVYVPFELIFA
jgi:hypothetical protein